MLGEETIHIQLGTQGCVFLGVIFYQCIGGALTDSLADIYCRSTALLQYQGYCTLGIGYAISAGGVFFAIACGLHEIPLKLDEIAPRPVRACSRGPMAKSWAHNLLKDRYRVPQQAVVSALCLFFTVPWYLAPETVLLNCISISSFSFPRCDVRRGGTERPCLSCNRYTRPIL